MDDPGLDEGGVSSDWSSDWDGESDEEQSESQDPESESRLESAESETLIHVSEGCVPGESYRDGNGSSDRQSKESQPEIVTMVSRAYQLEMLEESMKQNVIVAMDTGSGKTQVAVLRIKAELERTPSDKLVWFLAPTVALSAQQSKVLQSQIPGIQVKFLSSHDDLDSWSTKQIWTRALTNVRVVVSTYQVLYDAFSHAFVPVERVALIVFDEAHNCLGKKAPCRKIMTDFYQQNQIKGKPVPHILGLTASPSVSSKKNDLETLEKTLDATCKTPTIHREEFLSRVNRPTLQLIQYQSAVDTDGGILGPTTAMQSLETVRHHLDSMKSGGLANELDKFIGNLGKQDQYIRDQLLQFSRKIRSVFAELGAWAVDYYIWKIKDQFLSGHDSFSWWLQNWKALEKQRLAKELQALAASPPCDHFAPGSLSDKAKVLLKILSSRGGKGTVAIVFVKQRVTVSVLAHLLSVHPSTKDYCVGTMVGINSLKTQKRDMSEFWRKHQDTDADLQGFKCGKLNLLIATSVVEEGIDVPACNLVICFDQPPNLKSFVQRRGRARMKESSLILFHDPSDKDLPRNWEALEETVRKEYEDEDRVRSKMAALEAEEAPGGKPFFSKSNGRIDRDSAKSHLEHFCSVLSSGEARPEYIIRMDPFEEGKLQAEVILPCFVPEAARTATSKSLKSEKNAKKDAAFLACIGLYKEGLLSESFLPLSRDCPSASMVAGAKIEVVRELSNPWKTVAEDWYTSRLWSYEVVLTDQDGATLGEYTLTLPVDVAPPPPIVVYPEGGKEWRINIGKGLLCPELTLDDLKAKDHTQVLISLAYGHRYKWPTDYRLPVAAFAAKNASISHGQIGSRSFDPGLGTDGHASSLIRDSDSRPFIYEDIIPSKLQRESTEHQIDSDELAPSSVPCVALRKLTRRRDFLHPCTTAPGNGPALSSRVLPITEVKVDDIPLRHAYFGMLVPSILHELEVQLRVKALSEDGNSLADLDISDPHLVRTATSAMSAHEPTNYERIGFLGVSILKTATAINMAALHRSWPEGYLTFFKDRLVSNRRLSKAALDAGLDQYILTRPFTGQKWQPLYVDDLLASNSSDSEKPCGTRKMSSKTLAGVMEALIGACYIHGKWKSTLRFIAKLIPDHGWKPMEECRSILFEDARENIPLPSTLAHAEEIIGYQFKKKVLLIQALTHGSKVSDSDNFGSYGRLKFLGDALLDIIIVTKIFNASPTLTHSEIHTLKTAMVNGNFLAFLLLDRCVSQIQTVIDSTTVGISMQTSSFDMPLWRLMRHSSPSLGYEQEFTQKRYLELRDEIRRGLDETQDYYPWALLTRLQAGELYSDLFQAVLSAIWVDSGSWESCEAFLEQFGMLRRLDRLLRSDVSRLKHPKEELVALANREKIHYLVEVRTLEGEGGRGAFACKVSIGGRVIARVEDGVGKEEVKTKVAEAAVKVLRAERSNAGSEKEQKTLVLRQPKD